MCPRFLARAGLFLGEGGFTSLFSKHPPAILGTPKADTPEVMLTASLKDGIWGAGQWGLGRVPANLRDLLSSSTIRTVSF